MKTSKTSLLIQILRLLAATAFLNVPCQRSSACSVGGVGRSTSDGISVEFFENEPYARILLQRDGDTDRAQRVDYFTVDGPPGSLSARAGVHYLARSGTATFAIGQTVTSVDIPLIDNGLVDGARFFSLTLTNPTSGVTLHATSIGIKINDNELHATVDPLFVPDVAFSWFNPLVMPDERILVSAGPKGLTMLQSNGRVDVSFATRLATSVTNVYFSPLQVLGDGRIFAVGPEVGASSRQLVRLLPDGALDTLFTIPNFIRFVAAQPDRKILVLIKDGSDRIVLSRFQPEGAADPAFQPFPLLSDPTDYYFALQSDGKLLVAGYLGERRSSLIRLNLDGSPDGTFSPAVAGKIDSFVLRKDGRMIITGELSMSGPSQTGIVQVLPDGSTDSGFSLRREAIWSTTLVELKQPEGGVLAAIEANDADTRLLRWRQDGSLEAAFNIGVRGGGHVFSSCDWPLTMVQRGQLYLAATTLTNVDGFPRRGLARLLLNPPERDFRLLTPAEFSRSSGLARIRVLRTGPTAQAASVSFSTRDDTAKAGEDYLPRSGMLQFAPLQVSHEITVPLVARDGVEERLFFEVQLRDPSAGYTITPATPVAILSDLRIGANSLRSRSDGSVDLELWGTVPGLIYHLEVSSDLENWLWMAVHQASGPGVVFDSAQGFQAISPSNPLATGKPQFFRVRRD